MYESCYHAPFFLLFSFIPSSYNMYSQFSPYFSSLQVFLHDMSCPHWETICSEAISHGSSYLICQQRPLNEQADVNVLLEYFVNYKWTDWSASGHCNGHSSSSGSQYGTTRCWDSVNRKSHNICVSQASSGTNANCMSSSYHQVIISPSW